MSSTPVATPPVGALDIVPLFRVARSIATLTTLIGAVWVGAVVIWVLISPFSGLLQGALLAYGLIFLATSGVVRLSVPRLQLHLASGRLAQARDGALAWGVVGLFPGLAPGVVLLLASRKLGALLRGPTVAVTARASMPRTGPDAPSTGGVIPYSVPIVAPQITSVPAPTSGSVAADGPPLCARCQQPTTWIVEYRRWYCYRDQLYV